MNKVYSHFKIFHFKDKIRSLSQGVITPPIHVRLKPTNVCNCNCSYCCYRSQFNMQIGNDFNEKDYIPREKMFEIIDNFESMGVKAVTFSGGGEPLCYKYIKDTIKKFNKTKIKTAFLTNGTMLSGEIADLIAEKSSWVRISIDGWDAESYSKYRGVPITMYDRVIKNIRNFSKIKKACRLAASLIIDKENYSHVHEMILKFRDLGVDSVKASGVVVEDDVLKNNEYHKPIFQYVKAQLDTAIKELSSDKFEIFDAYHELSGTYSKDYTWCPSCQILAVVAADCNVYSCQDKAYNSFGIIGNIKDQSFKKMWNDGKDKFFRINPSKDCNHHCVQNYKNAHVVEYLDTDKEHLEFV